MIYETIRPDIEIRQGDIFVGLPRIDISLNEILVTDEQGERVADWKDLVQTITSTRVILPIRSVTAIVATQDCDATHGRDITLCEIQKFPIVYPVCKETNSPKSWEKIITQHSRSNLKWFYLPPDPTIGFTEKMAVDFALTLRIARIDLENLRLLRVGRLNSTADEHFRERIGEFFRRYPYDEWYPLNKEELAEYIKDYPETKPFPWQTTNAP
jgi:hypothetical protein